MSRRCVKIKMVNMEDGSSKIFPSITKCADYFGVNIGSINSVLNRDNKLYKYKYKIERWCECEDE